MEISRPQPEKHQRRSNAEEAPRGIALFILIDSSHFYHYLKKGGK
jgi:hypothetical protein